MQNSATTVVNSISTSFEWKHGRSSYAHSYLMPTIEHALKQLPPCCRVFDLGCGNGALAAWLSARNYEVTGVDPSPSGIARAQLDVPNARLELGSSNDNLAGLYGQFPIVFSLEVVEHVHSAGQYARTLFDLVQPGGTAILSTPYHGLVKNLAIILGGGFDKHFQPLSDHGHIKFWSIATLTQLIQGVGFDECTFYRVGRFAPVAKSMICVAHKP